MKTKILPLAFSLMAFALITCCKDKPDPDPLPPLTHEGKNTFGCYIDGEPFVAKVKFTVGGGTAVSANFNESTKYLILQGSHEYEGGAIESIGFSVYVTQGVANYVMKVNTTNKEGYTYGVATTIYYHDMDNKGTVNITFLDTDKNIISGRFEMTLINPAYTNNPNKPTMVITDGRFDVKY